MSKRTSDSLVFGIVLLVLGTAFLLRNFFPDINVWPTIARFWPLILIVFGIFKIKRALAQRAGRDETA